MPKRQISNKLAFPVSLGMATKYQRLLSYVLIALYQNFACTGFIKDRVLFWADTEI